MNPNFVKFILLLAITFGLGLAEAGGTRQWLSGQNKARRQVGLKPLRWDYKLARYAQWYGNQRRYDCAMIHSNGPYGENIFWGSGTRWTPQHAVNAWVSEKRFYNYRSNRCYGPDCGHYTQIVWRTAQRVGCARIVCNRGAGVLSICEYDPPGNWFGQRPY